jgi:hypothetical protein
MENDQSHRVHLGRIEAAGIALAVLGAVLIGLAWYALADERTVVEQLPYLASGGIGGLAVIVAGAALVHLTRQFRLEREVARMAAGQEELRDALVALAGSLGQAGDTPVPLATVGAAPGRAVRRGVGRTGGLARLEERSVTEQPG